MLFRSMVLAAVLAISAPAVAQDTDLRTLIAAYAKPSNADRLKVLTGQLEAAGLPYAIETFEGGNAQTGPVTGSNVVVVFNESPGARELLLTAHYDAARLPDGGLADGLVDNAASVVTLIEVAKAMKGKDVLNHPMRFIFFDQEELGLLGSRAWVAAHGVETVAAVVNSDVAAYGDTMMFGQNNGHWSDLMTASVLETCGQQQIQCVGYPRYPPSDDRSFVAAEAPTVSVGFQDEVGAHQMWLTFNGGEKSGLAEGFTPRVFETIHSDKDTIDVVDPHTVERAAEIYLALLQRLDIDRAVP